MSQSPARAKIIAAIPTMRFSMFGPAELGLTAGVAESTVRRHLDSLVREGYLSNTSYVGQYARGAKTLMSLCRGCGGTGIDAEVSPRAAQIASLPVLMRRTTGLIAGGGTTSVFRCQISDTLDRGRMKFYGPLVLLIEHIERRERDGYVIVEGDVPERALACKWCNGHGSTEGQLTVHALEKLAQS